ncbi:hypothetical protein O1D80_002570 [Vibrio cholerae]|nr:hypothetical protein [Vibrio cholerae]
MANTVFINSKVENKTVFNLSKSPNLAPNTFKNSTASSQFSPKISNQGLRYLFFKRLMVGVFLLLKIVFGQLCVIDLAKWAKNGLANLWQKPRADNYAKRVVIRVDESKSVTVALSKDMKSNTVKPSRDSREFLPHTCTVRELVIATNG